VNTDEEEDHRRGESGYAEAMHRVPFFVLREGVAGRGVGGELRHAVIDGHEEEEREDDDSDPDGYGGAEQRELGLVAVEDGFSDEEEKSEAVPEGHDETELRGKAANGGEAGSVVELTEDGVDESCDGELGTDHEANREDGCDVEK